MSVRKRTWTNAKGEAKQAWIVAYTDQAGKRHIKTFERKKEAETYAAATHMGVRDGTHTADSQSVTIAVAGKLWLATGEKNGLERSTLDAYRQHLDIHIRPYLGAVKLSQMTAPMVREFEDSLRSGTPLPASDAPAQRPRSAAMVKKVRTSLSSLLADAQERGLVGRNVVSKLRSTRGRGKERQAERRQKGKVRAGVDMPTREEIRAILASAKGRWRPFLLTAIFTGLRASEMRGLRWVDVDFKRNEIHVRQRADRYKVIGKPKSEAGERTVPLPPLAAASLREWQIDCPKSPDEIVFPTRLGQIEHHKNIVRSGLMPAQVAAGVTTSKVGADGASATTAKYPGLHALRHFYASWCINRKAEGGLELPPKMVQERLGHSSISMTMDVYGHMFPRGDDSEELEAAERSLIG